MKNKKTKVHIKKLFRHTNAYLYLSIVIIVCIYIFFFTSNALLPNGAVKNFTALGSAHSLENRDITIMRWDYSEKQGIMEIELDVVNNNFDGLDKYKFSAVTRPQSGCNITSIIEENNFIVLQIDNIPKKFKEISFRLSVDSETIESPEVLKMYSNYKDITYVDSITIRTKNEYLSARIEKLILEYQENITTIEGEITAMKEKITNIKNANLKLEEDKKYQSENEINKTNDTINSNLSKIKDLELQIKSADDHIQDLKEKIQKSEEKIKDISA